MTGLDHSRFFLFVLGFEPRISRVLGERHNQARPYEHWKPPTRIELVTLRLLSACSANCATGAGAPTVGLEPTTTRLRVLRSTN